MTIIIALLGSSMSEGAQDIKVMNEQVATIELENRAEKDMPGDGLIETVEIVNVKFNSGMFYIVPVKLNGEGIRGCFLYSYDKSRKLKEKVLISSIEELQICDLITDVFACNRSNKAVSGIGALYIKKFGSSHYIYGGSYLTLDSSGLLKVDDVSSKLMGGIDSVRKAKKKLGCIDY